MLFISQLHEIIPVVSAEISGAVPFRRMRVTICTHPKLIRERHLYLAAAAVHYVGVEKFHPFLIGLVLHDHPEPEFPVILFVVICDYRPKPSPHRG
jgi:hypothetical protein